MILFDISIAQGFFLIILLAVRSTKNRLAVHLLMVMLITIVLINLGYLTIRSQLLNYIPQLFGLPFGMMLLLGPLLYFYTRSVTDPSFRWKKSYLAHFIPYLIQLLNNIPFFFAGNNFWMAFINGFLSGHLAMPLTVRILYAFHYTHFALYLLLSLNWLRSVILHGRSDYFIPLASRIRWLRLLGGCFLILLICNISIFSYVLMHGLYTPLANYINTLVTSAIIYLVSFKLLLNPEPISPDFVQKNRTGLPLATADADKYLQRLKFLMDDSKMYADPDLKLALVAEKMELPPHQLSKLMNDALGKTFPDFVNEYRVKEFIRRINDSKYRSYSVFGIAMDVGFNSKSSFNNTFKKITGKTPSQFRK